MPIESNPYLPFFKVCACFGLDTGRLWLENLRRLRELQLKAGATAIEAVQEATTAVTEADDVATLLARQTELLWDQASQAPQYWRDFLLMTKDNQAAVLEEFQKTTDSCVSGCADAFTQMAKARPDTTPMEAWLNGMANATAFTIDAMTATTQGLHKMAEASATVPLPPHGQTAAAASKHH